MLWKWRIVAPGSLSRRVEEKRISFARSEFNYLKLPFVYYLSLATTAKTTLESATLTMDSSQDHACLPPEAMFSPSTTQRGGFARPSPLLGYYIFHRSPGDDPTKRNNSQASPRTPDKGNWRAKEVEMLSMNLSSLQDRSQES